MYNFSHFGWKCFQNGLLTFKLKEAEMANTRLTPLPPPQNESGSSGTSAALLWRVPALAVCQVTALMGPPSTKWPRVKSRSVPVLSVFCFLVAAKFSVPF